jgi:hypothetical protein
MAKTLRTSGDYTIKAGSGAAGTNQIDLDSQIVRVRGDLIVDGGTTTVNTATLSVEDTFIELARNNSNIPALDAGIYVNRGGAGDNAVFYWDESEDNFIIGTTTNDAGTSPLTNITYQNIKVATTPADANHATSKAYVDAQVVSASGMTDFIIVGDDSTGVTVIDGEHVQIAGGSNIGATVADPDTITISLKNDLSNITSVTSDASNSNLTLKANGTGSISINNILTFSSNASTPAAASVTKLYSKTVGGGGTGVFFINSAVGSGTEDELISKKKATALAIALG